MKKFILSFTLTALVVIVFYLTSLETGRGRMTTFFAFLYAALGIWAAISCIKNEKLSVFAGIFLGLLCGFAPFVIEFLSDLFGKSNPF